MADDAYLPSGAPPRKAPPPGAPGLIPGPPPPPARPPDGGDIIIPPDPSPRPDPRPEANTRDRIRDVTRRGGFAGEQVPPYYSRGDWHTAFSEDPFERLFLDREQHELIADETVNHHAVVLRLFWEAKVEEYDAGGASPAQKERLLNDYGRGRETTLRGIPGDIEKAARLLGSAAARADVAKKYRPPWWAAVEEGMAQTMTDGEVKPVEVAPILQRAVALGAVHDGAAALALQLVQEADYLPVEEPPAAPPAARLLSTPWVSPEVRERVVGRFTAYVERMLSGDVLEPEAAITLLEEGRHAGVPYTDVAGVVLGVLEANGWQPFSGRTPAGPTDEDRLLAGWTRHIEPVPPPDRAGVEEETDQERVGPPPPPRQWKRWAAAGLVTVSSLGAITLLMNQRAGSSERGGASIQADTSSEPNAAGREGTGASGEEPEAPDTPAPLPESPPRGPLEAPTGGSAPGPPTLGQQPGRDPRPEPPLEPLPAPDPNRVYPASELTRPPALRGSRPRRSSPPGGFGGAVRVAVLVDVTGRVAQATCVPGPAGSPCAEAIAAAYEARFSPGQFQGSAVRSRTEIPVFFDAPPQPDLGPRPSDGCTEEDAGRQTALAIRIQTATDPAVRARYEAELAELQRRCSL